MQVTASAVTWQTCDNHTSERNMMLLITCSVMSGIASCFSVTQRSWESISHSVVSTWISLYSRDFSCSCVSDRALWIMLLLMVPRNNQQTTCSDKETDTSITDKQTDRHSDKETNKYSTGQTDRQTDRHTHTHTHTHTLYYQPVEHWCVPGLRHVHLSP